MLAKTITHCMAVAALEIQLLLHFVKAGIHKKVKKKNNKTTRTTHKQHKSQTKALLMFKFYSEIQPQGTRTEEYFWLATSCWSWTDELESSNLQAISYLKTVRSCAKQSFLPGKNNRKKNKRSPGEKKHPLRTDSPSKMGTFRLSFISSNESVSFNYVRNQTCSVETLINNSLHLCCAIKCHSLTYISLLNHCCIDRAIFIQSLPEFLQAAT